MEKRAVLFVDDDEIVLKTIEKSIMDDSFDKYFATSGEKALEILKQKDVHVIVVDIVMPGMDGIELLKIVKKEYPNIVIMVMSGYSQSADAMMALCDIGVYKFFPKTWNYDEDSRSVIQRAINTYNLQSEHNDMMTELEYHPDQTISAK